MSNIVDAISDMHEELSGDVATLKTDMAGVKTDVATLKTEMAGIKTDVAKLLHHFGIASGGSP